MKTFLALVILLMSTSSFAVTIEDESSMNQKPLSSAYKAVRYERKDKLETDAISTGQSSVKRDKNREARCVDRSGYAYSKYDSGFAACVNQVSEKMKNR